MSKEKLKLKMAASLSRQTMDSMKVVKLVFKIPASEVAEAVKVHLMGERVQAAIMTEVSEGQEPQKFALGKMVIDNYSKARDDIKLVLKGDSTSLRDVNMEELGDLTEKSFYLILRG